MMRPETTVAFVLPIGPVPTIAEQIVNVCEQGAKVVGSFIEEES
jgi:hypothetical protein